MNRGWTTVVAGGLAMIAGAAPAAAHHAIGATVDTNKEVVQTMTLTRVDWINPHAWFHFTMKRSDGSTLKDVMIEWLSLAGLKQAGYGSADNFPVGTSYKVTYNPNRDGSPGGHLVKLIDPQGNVYER